MPILILLPHAFHPSCCNHSLLQRRLLEPHDPTLYARFALGIRRSSACPDPDHVLAPHQRESASPLASACLPLRSGLSLPSVLGHVQHRRHPAGPQTRTLRGRVLLRVLPGTRGAEPHARTRPGAEAQRGTEARMSSSPTRDALLSDNNV